MSDEKERGIRIEQIAATILYRYFGDITITVSMQQHYDLLVTYNDGTELKFGVEVKSDKATPLHFDRIINHISLLDFSEKSNRLPVILLVVNEETETAKVGFLVGWRFGKPQIYRDFELRNLNEKSSGLCLQLIKSMDDVIRVLSVDDINVLKTITFSRAVENGRKQQAQVMYLRKLSSEYRMKQKEVVTEKERFERLLKGTPEEEYPNDELDRLIFESINETYKNAKPKSSILLLSTELEDLQYYKRFHCHHTKLLVSPDLNNLPMVVMSMLDGLELFSVDIDIFVENILYQDAFDTVSFDKEEPLDGWVKKVTKWNKLKETMRPISTYFR